MVQQSGQRIVSSLLLGIVKQLQILNRGTGLAGKGQDRLFVQFGEPVRETLLGHFIGEKQSAEESALASY
jgi:hypothetical protein